MIKQIVRRLGCGITVMATMLWGSCTLTEASETKRTCLVLADGYVSEYAWGRYEEMEFSSDHPGHVFCVRGLLNHSSRFNRWLDKWKVTRIDLEKQQGPLLLDEIDLVVLDEVRQSVCDPYESSLVEFVRGGGGLLIHAGFWSLGGCPKSRHNTNQVISSFQHTPLGKILPVEIVATPDLEMLDKKPKSSRTPHFLDQAFGDGIETSEWELFGIHACKPRGQVVAELDGKPLISYHDFGQGRVVVYTSDDLAWVRAGASNSINRFSGTLWQRLAALAVRDDMKTIPAAPDPVPTWDKRAAFAHPDQPMNFLWGGYFYYRTPAMERLWAKDLIEHSVTLYSGAPEAIGKAGVLGWEGFGRLPATNASADDQSVWCVDPQGNRVKGWHPCFNNPKALKNMDESAANRALELSKYPWLFYGHMGDESDFENCFCEYCRKAFGEEFGYELPRPKNDFSPDYLDQWIDYCIFKNRSIGRMYARAAHAAHEKNPRLKMFSSIPQSGGMAHGDDQFHTQSGFDVLWDHTYPGTMAIGTGLNASLLEETAVLQGRPYVPIMMLLQGFDSYDRVPHMPPAEYIREMTWQAISHGADSIGWFVYNAFWWNLPGTEAWEEIGRLGRQVLEPLTPALYEMSNAPQPVGLLYSYSQEAVDGLKELMWDKQDPWKSVIRWRTQHATQEAYEVLKYAHIPSNVVSEYRLLQNTVLPWKVIIIPYAEHLHAKILNKLESYISQGGIVYVGANSTLDLPGIKKLPVSFDAKFNTWWPKEKTEEWNQRRVRVYLISTLLEKSRQMSQLLLSIHEKSLVTIKDPEVIYNVREAGVAKYLFFINDHQINPVSPDLRKKRQEYNHFMLMPMEFPKARTVVGVQSQGYLYSLMPTFGGLPMELKPNKRTLFDLELNGGDGKVFLLLPEKIKKVEFVAPPVRGDRGVSIEGRVLNHHGEVINASLPLRIEMNCGEVHQAVYATTRNGVLSWTVPFLRTFPSATITVIVTDLASGISTQNQTR